jgi:hypothetical protein
VQQCGEWRVLGGTAPGVNGEEDNPVLLRTYAHVVIMRNSRAIMLA